MYNTYNFKKTDCGISIKKKKIKNIRFLIIKVSIKNKKKLLIRENKKFFKVLYSNYVFLN